MKNKCLVAILSLILLCSIVACKPPTEVELSLNVYEISIMEGNTYQLTIGGATNAEAVWESSSPYNATVVNGLVSANAEGTAVVTATAHGKAVNCTITITKQEEDDDVGDETSVILNIRNINLLIGEEITLVATVRKAGQPLNAAVTWTTTDESIATVNNGKVTTIAKGIATIRATAGLASASCTVTVGDSIAITLSKQNLSIDVFDTYLLNAMVYINGALSQDTEIIWASSNENIANINQGLITALRPGNAIISATVENITIYCSVNVFRVASYSLYLDKTQDIVSWDFTNSGIPVSDITSIIDKTSQSEIEINYTVNGTEIIFNKNDLIIGARQYTFYTNSEEYYVDVTVATFLISNAADMAAFSTLLTSFTEAGNENILKDQYFALTNDIDYAGGLFQTTGYSKRFEGTFDGRGHTIFNIEFVGGLFNYLRGTVKNLNLINAIANSSFMICNEADSSANIENIFIQGKVLASSANVAGIISRLGSGIRIRNIIAFIEMPNVPSSQVTGSIVRRNDGTVENCFGISVSADGLFRENNGSITNSEHYSSLEEFINDTSKNITVFKGYWNTNSGLPIFKKYFEYLNSITLEFANEVSTVPVDSKLQAICNMPYVLYNLEGVKEGVTIDSKGIITIASSTTAGSFTVNAISILDNSKTASKTFTVLESSNLTGMGHNIYFEKSTQSDYYTWDVSDLLEIIECEIDSIILKGAIETPVSFTVAQGILTVAKSELSGLQQGNYTMFMISREGHNYAVEAHLAYMVISDADDLTAFMNLMLNAPGESNANYFTDELFILSSNIDYGNQTYLRMPPAKKFRGIFDGNGHTIENIEFALHMFGYLTGTVQNLSFINVVSNGNSIIANETGSPARLQNLFMQGIVKGTDASGLINSPANSNTIISNCIVIVEFPNVADGQITGSLARRMRSGCIIENSFTISFRADALVRTQEGIFTNSANYTTLTEFFAANNDLSSFTGLWNTNLGIPLLKSYFESLENLEITNDVTFTAPDSSLQVTSNSLVSYSLLEPYAGVSISADGIITVSSNAEPGEFVVVAASIFNPSITATKQFSVISLTTLDLIGMGYNIYFDNSIEGVNYSWDISSLSERIDNEIETIIFKGNTDILLPFSVDLAMLTVAKSDLSGVSQGNYTLLIMCKNGQSFEVEAHLAYMVISNSTDLTAFMNLMLNVPGESNANYFSDELFILSSDIDYGNQIYSRMPSAKKFRGIFDGNGHTIKNIEFALHMFGYLTGTVKNLSFINVLSNSNSIIANETASPARLHNLFVQGIVNGNGADAAGLINSPANSNTIISNCIVIVEFPNVADGQITGSLARRMRSGCGIENSFTISSRADGLVRTQEGTFTNSSNYATLEAFFAANNDLSSFTGFWNTSSGIPLLKSYYESLDNIEITNDVTDVGNDSTLQVTANNKLVKYSLLQFYEGVSISEQGMITVTSEAEPGVFTVIATSIFDSGKTAIKQFTVQN